MAELGEDFGQRVDVCVRIREVMSGYPQDSQLSEFLQNADDATAQHVTLCLDTRQHGVEGLPNEGMASLAGPALLVYNDAVFSDSDLRSIQRIGDSGKRHDNSTKHSTGRYGIGFNAVFHVTEVPMFVTRTFLVMLDPQARYLPGVKASEPGKLFDWRKDVTQAAIAAHPDMFAPFRAFGCDLKGEYRGTLFRLPLRTEAQAGTSRLSSTARTVSDMRSVLQSFAETAEDALLFLKHVKGVSVAVWEQGADGPTEICSARISNWSPDLQTRRAGVMQDRGKDDIVVAYDNVLRTSVTWHPDAVLHGFVAAPRTNNSEWLVCQQYGGSGIRDFLKESDLEHLKLVPWGGVAVKLSSDFASFVGHAYCTLPLPIDTGFPFHVNGVFEIGANRRELWHGKALRGESAARSEWNRLLLSTTVADCVSRSILLLHTIANHGHTPTHMEISSAVPKSFCWHMLPLNPLEMSSPWNSLRHAALQNVATLQIFPVLTPVRCANIMAAFHPASSTDRYGSSTDLSVGLTKANEDHFSRADAPSMCAYILSMESFCKFVDGEIATAPDDMLEGAAVGLMMGNLRQPCMFLPKDMHSAFVGIGIGPAELSPMRLRYNLRASTPKIPPSSTQPEVSRLLVGFILRDVWSLPTEEVHRQLDGLLLFPTAAEAWAELSDRALLLVPTTQLEREVLRPLSHLTLLGPSVDNGTALLEELVRKFSKSGSFLGMRMVHPSAVAQGFQDGLPDFSLCDTTWTKALWKYLRLTCPSLLDAAGDGAFILHGAPVIPLLRSSAGSAVVPMRVRSDDSALASWMNPILYTSEGQRMSSEVLDMLQQCGVYISDLSVMSDTGIGTSIDAIHPELRQFVLPATMSNVLDVMARTALGYGDGGRSCCLEMPEMLLSEHNVDNLQALVKDLRPATIDIGQLAEMLGLHGPLTRPQKLAALLLPIFPTMTGMSTGVVRRGQLAAGASAKLMEFWTPAWLTDLGFTSAVASITDSAYLSVLEPAGVVVATNLLALVAVGVPVVCPPVAVYSVLACNAFSPAAAPMISNFLSHIALLSVQEVSDIWRETYTNVQYRAISEVLQMVRTNPCITVDSGLDARLPAELYDPAVQELRGFLPDVLFPSSAFSSAPCLDTLRGLGLRSCLTPAAVIQQLKDIAVVHDEACGALSKACDLQDSALLTASMHGLHRVLARASRAMSYLSNHSAMYCLRGSASKESTRSSKWRFPSAPFKKQQQEPECTSAAIEDITAFRRELAYIKIVPVCVSCPLEYFAEGGIMPLDLPLVGAMEDIPLEGWRVLAAIAKHGILHPPGMVQTDCQWIERPVATVCASSSSDCMALPMAYAEAVSEKPMPAGEFFSEDAEELLSSKFVRLYQGDNPIRCWQLLSTTDMHLLLNRLQWQYHRLRIANSQAQMLTLSEAGSFVTSVQNSELYARYSSMRVASSECFEMFCRNVAAGVDTVYKELGSASGDTSVTTAPLVWVNHEFGFVNPQVVALQSGLSNHVSAPYLFTLDYSIALGSVDALVRMGVKRQFASEDYVSALASLAADYGGEAACLTQNHLELVTLLLSRLSDDLPVGLIYAPDEVARMRPASELFFNDAPWVTQDVRNRFPLVHPKISNLVAVRVGCRSLRSGLLRTGKAISAISLESSIQAFGQGEALTHRIKSILDMYPEGPSSFFEFIQNAEDAGARNVKIAIDLRRHGCRSLLDPTMEVWQGPAVIVYNDAEFKQADFANLVRLGQSMKATDVQSAGRFGLGFNAAYHFCDVPQIVSGGDVVFFDPHAKYVPGATVAQPGIRVRFADSSLGGLDLRESFPDQFDPLCLFGCDMRNHFAGTLFRFPLRDEHTASLSDIKRAFHPLGPAIPSGNAYSEKSGVTRSTPVTELLDSLATHLPDALLFLNSVKSIQLLHIDHDGAQEVFCCSSSLGAEAGSLATAVQNDMLLAGGLANLNAARLQSFATYAPSPVRNMRDADGKCSASFYDALEETEPSKLPKRSQLVRIACVDSRKRLSDRIHVEVKTYLKHERVGGGRARALALREKGGGVKLVPFGGAAVELAHFQSHVPPADDPATSLSANIAQGNLQLAGADVVHPRSGGIAYAFLPVPVFKGALPVCVNGYFELSSSRRDLWWHADSLDGVAKLKALWNSFLLLDVIAPCYGKVIIDLLNLVSTSESDVVDEEFTSAALTPVQLQYIYSIYPTEDNCNGIWSCMVPRVLELLKRYPVCYIPCSVISHERQGLAKAHRAILNKQQSVNEPLIKACKLPQSSYDVRTTAMPLLRPSSGLPSWTSVECAIIADDSDAATAALVPTLQAGGLSVALLPHQVMTALQIHIGGCSVLTPSVIRELLRCRDFPVAILHANGQNDHRDASAHILRNFPFLGSDDALDAVVRYALSDLPDDSRLLSLHGLPLVRLQDGSLTTIAYVPLESEAFEPRMHILESSIEVALGTKLAAWVVAADNHSNKLLFDRIAAASRPHTFASCNIERFEWLNPRHLHNLLAVVPPAILGRALWTQLLTLEAHGIASTDLQRFLQFTCCLPVQCVEVFHDGSIGLHSIVKSPSSCQSVLCASNIKQMVMSGIAEDHVFLRLCAACEVVWLDVAETTSPSQTAARLNLWIGNELFHPGDAHWVVNACSAYSMRHPERLLRWSDDLPRANRLALQKWAFGNIVAVVDRASRTSLAWISDGTPLVEAENRVLSSLPIFEFGTFGSSDTGLQRLHGRDALLAPQSVRPLLLSNDFMRPGTSASRQLAILCGVPIVNMETFLIRHMLPELTRLLTTARPVSQLLQAAVNVCEFAADHISTHAELVDIFSMNKWVLCAPEAVGTASNPTLSNLPCSLFSPGELFDPEVETLRSLLPERCFPHPAYFAAYEKRDDVLNFLRMCGLRSNMDGEAFLAAVHACALDGSMESSKHVALRLLSLLQTEPTLHSLDAAGISSFERLRNIAWLPATQAPAPLPRCGASACLVEPTRVRPKAQAWLCSSMFMSLDAEVNNELVAVGLGWVYSKGHAMAGMPCIPLSVLIHQVFALAEIIPSLKDASTEFVARVGAEFSVMYKLIDYHLSTSDAASTELRDRCSEPGLPIWMGSSFVNSRYMYLESDRCLEPVLHAVPPQYCQFTHMLNALDVAAAPQAAAIQRGLRGLQLGAQLDEASTTNFIGALRILTEDASSPATLDVPLLDSSSVLKPARVLVFNDAPWLPPDTAAPWAHRLVHPSIPPEVAKRSGASPLTEMLVRREPPTASLNCVAAGDVRQLSNRLSYEAALCEAVSCVDDLGFRELSLVLDLSQYASTSLMSPLLFPLQGPALCLAIPAFMANDTVSRLFVESTRAKPGGLGRNLCPLFKFGPILEVFNGLQLWILDPFGVATAGTPMIGGASSTFAVDTTTRSRFPDQFEPLRKIHQFCNYGRDCTIIRVALSENASLAYTAVDVWNKLWSAKTGSPSAAVEVPDSLSDLSSFLDWYPPRGVVMSTSLHTITSVICLGDGNIWRATSVLQSPDTVRAQQHLIANDASWRKFRFSGFFRGYSASISSMTADVITTISALHDDTVRFAETFGCRWIIVASLGSQSLREIVLGVKEFEALAALPLVYMAYPLPLEIRSTELVSAAAETRTRQNSTHLITGIGEVGRLFVMGNPTSVVTGLHAHIAAPFITDDRGGMSTGEPSRSGYANSPMATFVLAGGTVSSAHSWNKQLLHVALEECFPVLLRVGSQASLTSIAAGQPALIESLWPSRSGIVPAYSGCMSSVNIAAICAEPIFPVMEAGSVRLRPLEQVWLAHPMIPESLAAYLRRILPVAKLNSVVTDELIKSSNDARARLLDRHTLRLHLRKALAAGIPTEVEARVLLGFLFGDMDTAPAASASSLLAVRRELVGCACIPLEGGGIGKVPAAAEAPMLLAPPKFAARLTAAGISCVAHASPCICGSEMSLDCFSFLQPAHWATLNCKELSPAAMAEVLPCSPMKWCFEHAHVRIQHPLATIAPMLPEVIIEAVWHSLSLPADTSELQNILRGWPLLPVKKLDDSRVAVTCRDLTDVWFPHSDLPSDVEMLLVKLGVMVFDATSAPIPNVLQLSAEAAAIRCVSLLAQVASGFGDVDIWQGFGIDDAERDSLLQYLSRLAARAVGLDQTMASQIRRLPVFKRPGLLTWVTANGPHMYVIRDETAVSQRLKRLIELLESHGMATDHAGIRGSHRDRAAGERTPAATFLAYRASFEQLYNAVGLKAVNFIDVCLQFIIPVFETLTGSEKSLVVAEICERWPMLRLSADFKLQWSRTPWVCAALGTSNIFVEASKVFSTSLRIPSLLQACSVAFPTLAPLALQPLKMPSEMEAMAFDCGMQRQVNVQMLHQWAEIIGASNGAHNLTADQAAATFAIAACLAAVASGNRESAELHLQLCKLQNELEFSLVDDEYFKSLRHLRLLPVYVPPEWAPAIFDPSCSDDGDGNENVGGTLTLVTYGSCVSAEYAPCVWSVLPVAARTLLPLGTQRDRFCRLMEMPLRPAVENVHRHVLHMLQASQPIGSLADPTVLATAWPFVCSPSDFVMPVLDYLRNRPQDEVCMFATLPFIPIDELFVAPTSMFFQLPDEAEALYPLLLSWPDKFHSAMDVGKRLGVRDSPSLLDLAATVQSAGKVMQDGPLNITDLLAFTSLLSAAAGRRMEGMHLLVPDDASVLRPTESVVFFGSLDADVETRAALLRSGKFVAHPLISSDLAARLGLCWARDAVDEHVEFASAVEAEGRRLENRLHSEGFSDALGLWFVHRLMAGSRGRPAAQSLLADCVRLCEHSATLSQADELVATALHKLLRGISCIIANDVEVLLHIDGALISSRRSRRIFHFVRGDDGQLRAVCDRKNAVCALGLSSKEGETVFTESSVVRLAWYLVSELLSGADGISLWVPFVNILQGPEWATLGPPADVDDPISSHDASWDAHFLRAVPGCKLQQMDVEALVRLPSRLVPVGAVVAHEAHIDGEVILVYGALIDKVAGKDGVDVLLDVGSADGPVVVYAPSQLLRVASRACHHAAFRAAADTISLPLETADASQTASDLLSGVVKSAVAEPIVQGERMLKAELAAIKLEIEQLKAQVQRETQAYLCSICYTRDVDRVLVPCGHLICQECIVAGRLAACPFDRQTIHGTVPFFRPTGA